MVIFISYVTNYQRVTRGTPISGFPISKYQGLGSDDPTRRTKWTSRRLQGEKFRCHFGEIFRHTGLLVSSCDVYYTDTANKLYIYTIRIYICTYIYIHTYVCVCMCQLYKYSYIVICITIYSHIYI